MSKSKAILNFIFFPLFPANYALGKFKHITDGDDPLTVVQNPSSEDLVRKRTVGILDMGGGSMQIAFEITKEKQWKDIQAEPAANQLIAEFNLGNLAVERLGG